MKKVFLYTESYFRIAAASHFLLLSSKNKWKSFLPAQYRIRPSKKTQVGMTSDLFGEKQQHVRPTSIDLILSQFLIAF